MKYIFWIIIVLFVGCQGRISDDDMKHLTGYWEISSVRFADGSRKEFKINETVEHFKLNEKYGTRQKVKPQFDGSYVPTGKSGKFEVIDMNGVTHLKYTAEFHSWTEEILTLTKDELVVRESEIEYTYKRSVPFNIK